MTMVLHRARSARSAGKAYEAFLQATATKFKVPCTSWKRISWDHPAVSFALTNLAALCRDQGRYDEAESVALRALEIREKSQGADDPDAAPCLSILAGLYCEQGRFDEADSFFRRSLEIQEKALGPEHPGLAFANLGLARLYELRENQAKAEIYFSAWAGAAKQRSRW